ncbi:MAG: DUF2911 domain-containing protein [Gemmatimonadaceae bacterium]
MLRTSLAVLTLVATGSTLGAQQPPPSPTPLNAAASTRAITVVNLAPPRGAQGEGMSPATISVNYGQPHLRGRALHTGNLVPLDSVWRFGANESSTLDTGVDLTLGGQHVPKGKYSLYALPTSAGWTLIVNRNTGQWGTEYVGAQDVARIPLRRRALASPMESFTVWLIPTAPQTGAASGELRFAWGSQELSTAWSVR